MNLINKLSDFIGKKEVKDTLQVYIDACNKLITSIGFWTIEPCVIFIFVFNSFAIILANVVLPVPGNP